jgi:predicted transcriptional regulator of viral defense system
MTTKVLSLAQAVSSSLASEPDVVISRFQLAKIVWDMYLSGSYGGELIAITRETLNLPAFKRVESDLLANGVILPVPGVGEKVAYTLTGRNTADARVLACGLDPFCYVSHLSAMELHGLTDRLPEILYFCSPDLAQWRSLAKERMAKSLGGSLTNYEEAGLPKLTRISFSRLLGKRVHKHVSSYHGAYRVLNEQHLRVATLGRTYLDMLKEPLLCGGIMHVLETYRTHASTHLKLILDEIDQHGGPIDKVRAGFILEELCGLKDSRIDQWKVFAARGGSRKLDTGADYSPNFSEAWCLSINVPVPHDWA